MSSLEKSHIQSLIYKFNSRTPIAEDAEQLDFRNDFGHFVLKEGILTVNLSSENNTDSEARNSLKEFLLAWSFEHELRQTSWIDFFFAFSYSISKNGEIVSQSSDNLDYLLQKDDSNLIIELRSYPSPPEITLTQEMKTIWHRFNRAIIGIGEPIQSVAYYALTVIEQLAGGRQQASEKYAINMDVLRKLGELTSTRGEPLNARKALSKGYNPLTKKEAYWIDLTLRNIVHHIGLVNAGRKPEFLTFNDLPQI